MTLTIHPIYQIFPLGGDQAQVWEAFQTEVNNEKSWKTNQPDLEMTVDPQSCCKTAGKVALIVAKICILPWGICSGIKFCINKFALRQVYPAQRRFSQKELNLWRTAILHDQNQGGRILRHLRLKRDGESYSAFLISSVETIANGQWALHAGGNKAAIEHECGRKPSYADAYLKEGFNVLFVNGPGVGLSSTMDSIQQLGNAQELGLCFLESAIKAQRIVLTGVSIGSGALSLAINRHTFLQDREYLVLRFATFGRLSDAIKIASGKCGQFLLSKLGCEIDSVSASRKLDHLGIPEIIYQNEDDRQMKNAALNAELAFALQQEGPFQHKAFKVIAGAAHHHLSYDQVSTELQLWQHRGNEAEAV